MDQLASAIVNGFAFGVVAAAVIVATDIACTKFNNATSVRRAYELALDNARSDGYLGVAALQLADLRRAEQSFEPYPACLPVASAGWTCPRDDLTRSHAPLRPPSP